MWFLDLSRLELDVYFTTYDVKRLEMYSNNLVDYHLIMDLMPTLARAYFLKQMGDVSLSAVQSVSWWHQFVIFNTHKFLGNSVGLGFAT